MSRSYKTHFYKPTYWLLASIEFYLVIDKYITIDDLFKEYIFPRLDFAKMDSKDYVANDKITTRE